MYSYCNALLHFHVVHIVAVLKNLSVFFFVFFQPQGEMLLRRSSDYNAYCYWLQHVAFSRSSSHRGCALQSVCTAYRCTAAARDWRILQFHIIRTGGVRRFSRSTWISNHPTTNDFLCIICCHPCDKKQNQIWPDKNIRIVTNAQKPAWLICADFPLPHFHVSSHNIHLFSFCLFRYALGQSTASTSNTTSVVLHLYISGMENIRTPTWTWLHL